MSINNYEDFFMNFSKIPLKPTKKKTSNSVERNNHNTINSTYTTEQPAKVFPKFSHHV